jgi:hypothetical protein
MCLPCEMSQASQTSSCMRATLQRKQNPVCKSLYTSPSPALSTAPEANRTKGR